MVLYGESAVSNLFRNTISAKSTLTDEVSTFPWGGRGTLQKPHNAKSTCLDEVPTFPGSGRGTLQKPNNAKSTCVDEAPTFPWGGRLIYMCILCYVEQNI